MHPVLVQGISISLSLGMLRASWKNHLDLRLVYIFAAATVTHKIECYAFYPMFCYYKACWLPMWSEQDMTFTKLE